MKVKICGIKDLPTAKQAVDAGADALGFVFARQSKRYIKPEEAKNIISALPRTVQAIGVFVNAPALEITRIADMCNLDIVQLHGDEKINHQDLDLPVIKCHRVKDRPILEEIICTEADAILLDTYHPHMDGGTGKTFNWSTLRNFPIKLPLILAGGLTSDNVKEAIETVKPCAVDVSSGVETNGVKDASKIKSFIRRAKEVQL